MTRSLAGIADFRVHSEQYYMHTDPGKQGARDDDLFRR